MSNVIKIAILGDARSIQEASLKTVESLGKVESKTSSTSQKIAGIGSKLAVGIGTIGVAVAAFAVKSGSALEDSQGQLDNALDRTHQKVSDFGDALGPLLKQNEKWGITNDKVNDSLADLVRAGAKGKAALTDERIAANLAAAKHIALASATGIVSKVLTGHVSLLGRYGIATKDATGKTISQSAALKLLADRFGGAASKSAEQFSGKIAAGKAQLTDMAAKIGLKLIPILEKLGVDVASVVGWLSQHKAVTIALGVVIGTVVAGLIAYAAAVKAIEIGQKLWTVATKLATAAQWLFNAAMDANPIALVIAGLAALAAGIYLAYKHFGPFHDAVDKAWQILQDAFHWVEHNWPLLLAILTGPIGLAVLAITKNWSSIKSGFTAVKDWIGDRVSDIVGFFVALPGRIAALAGRIGGAALGVGNSIATGILHGITGAAGEVASFAKSIVNASIGYVNRNVIDKLDSGLGNIKVSFFGHSIGLPSHLIPDIPILHSGGIFNSGMGEGLALLQDGEGIFTPTQMRALGSFGGRSGNTYINLPAGLDPNGVVRAQKRYERRNGFS